MSQNRLKPTGVEYLKFGTTMNTLSAVPSSFLHFSTYTEKSHTKFVYMCN